MVPALHLGSIGDPPRENRLAPLAGVKSGYGFPHGVLFGPTGRGVYRIGGIFRESGNMTLQG